MKEWYGLSLAVLSFAATFDALPTHTRSLLSRTPPRTTRTSLVSTPTQCANVYEPDLRFAYFASSFGLMISLNTKLMLRAQRAADVFFESPRKTPKTRSPSKLRIAPPRSRITREQHV